MKNLVLPIRLAASEQKPLEHDALVEFLQECGEFVCQAFEPGDNAMFIVIHHPKPEIVVQLRRLELEDFIWPEGQPSASDPVGIKFGKVVFSNRRYDRAHQGGDAYYVASAAGALNMVRGIRELTPEQRLEIIQMILPHSDIPPQYLA